MSGDYKNILVIRTDRVGDVVLTTPVISALRTAFPDSRISMLVRPETREIVEDHPGLDEVLVDDRQGVHKGTLGFLRLVGALRARKFDVVINYHTKVRANLLSFFSGIPRRIGYRNQNKLGFLLTDRLADTRPFGLKHEVQYCLDVLKTVGIESKVQKLFLNVRPEESQWARNFLREAGIIDSDAVIAIHPGASCISKRWMPVRFAEVADQLIEKHRAKVILVGGPENREIVAQIHANLKEKVVDTTGKTSLRQLAALLKRSKLLISNDSGPVHIAVAVGTPVISIFGRKQAGLSPLRWRPLGERDVVLHKEVGCPICLAHNCQIDFKCLQEITTAEVLQAVDGLVGVW